MIEKPQYARDAVHRIVHRDDRAFTSHPFLAGLWRVGNGDIVAGFMKAPCAYGDAGDVHHDTITVSRRRMCTVRSSDNGATWPAQTLATVFETPEPAAFASAPDGPLDLDGPDTIVATGASPALLVPEATPWARTSIDGGLSWRAPARLPMSRFASLSGHGSFMRRGDAMWIAALTAASADGWRRRPVLFASRDGTNWAFLSFVTPPAWDDETDAPHAGTPRFWAHRAMYPRPIQLRDGRILVAIRAQRDPTGAMWTELYDSDDGGRTFRFLARPNDFGAPADLVQMGDGRIACVYGYRLAPSGVRARISADGGRAWGREIILRDDGASWDVGYPRVIEHAPGRLLATYYINCAESGRAHGVRHVAMTDFAPE